MEKAFAFKSGDGNINNNITSITPTPTPPPPPLPDSIRLKVGFEIHQQLATNSKLFCNCSCKETDSYGLTLVRKLRPTQSELGVYDPAALFEFKKMRTIKYHSAPGSSCLVEADEEPPHDVSPDALETALIFSLALHSTVVDEVHVMRKIVIDGSNTSGFQRTMLVAHGGYLDIRGTKVGVQSICLEEDAAKLISDDGSIREYGLDRLGVPLVEIALEPVTGKPEEIMQIALNLGRLLRASKRVARGLGSIRQDVNISVLDGSVVEIKGVQQLDQLIKVIEYEMLRQHGLYIISQRLKTRNVQEDQIGDLVVDVTDIFAKSSSKVVKKTLAHSDTVFVAIRAKGFAGSIGFEPYPEIRLGKQLGELVRFYGLGGVFHSDELPNYGITEKDVSELNSRLQCMNGDAFVLVGGSKERVGFAVDALIQRLKVALTGVPAETRAATLEGKTVFSRPRPGSARMYPETDIAPIPINPVLLKSLSNKIPMPWDRLVNNLTQQYNLNNKVAEQIFDSKYFSLFEQISNSTKVAPTFIASKLTEDIVNLQRQGLDSSLLSDGAIVDVFNRLNSNKIAKESIVLIFEKIMNRSAESVDDAISMLGVTNLDNDDLDKVIDKIIQDNLKTIDEKGTGSLGMLMGRAMAVLRGKADGQKINALVSKKLHEVLTK